MRPLHAHLQRGAGLPPTLLALIVAAGCADVAATNPFDPATPQAQQAPGRLIGRLYREVPGDLGPTAYAIQVRDARSGVRLDADGNPRVWNTRVDGDDPVEGLDPEPGIVGAFEIKLYAGVYELIFDATQNDRPQLADTSSGALVLEPGATIVYDLRVRANAGGAAFQCFDDRDCDLGSRCTEGQCVVDVEADRDRDGVPDGTVDQPRDNCPDTSNPDQEDIDGDGLGDACDPDDDADGVADAPDNCPRVRNVSQADADADGVGNACDEDTGGTTVTGVLDFSALPGADPGAARVTLVSPAGEVDTGVDPDGRFTFDQALPDAGLFVLRAEWPGFVPLSRAFVAAPDQASFDAGALAMLPEAGDVERAAPLQGTVTLEGGDNPWGVVVEARVGGDLVATAVTDRGGAFALRVGRVDHVLRFSRDRFAALEVTAVYNEQGEHAARFTVDGAPIEDAELRLAALPRAALTGELTSVLEVDDWPARALVTVVGDGELHLATIANTPDGKGRFDVDGLLPGQYFLSAQAEGHRPVARPIDVPAAGLRMGDVPLEPVLVPYAARVVDGNGQPVDSAIVRAYRGEISADTAFSDPDGAFTLTLTPETHTLRFAREGFQALAGVLLDWDPLAGRFAVREADAPPFVMLATPIATLSGRVASDQGALTDWPSRAFATLVSADGAVRRLEPVVDADLGHGQFQFTGLVPGDYTLGITAQGHFSWSSPVRLPVGERTLEQVLMVGEVPGLVQVGEHVVIRLDRSATALLLGRVRLAGSETHGGVQVGASVNGNLVAAGSTLPDGSFAIPTSTDDHLLTLSHEGFQPRDVEVTWDEAEARFEVQGTPLADAELLVASLPVAHLTGRITSQLGLVDDWSNRAFVSLVADDHTVRRIEPVLPGGEFEFAGIPPGGYTVSASVRGHTSVSQHRDLVEGENDPVEFLAVPEAFDDEEAVLLSSTVHLADVGEDGDHAGIVVNGRIGANVVFQVTTNNQGRFYAAASREAHVLTFSKAGYQPSGEHQVDWFPGAEDPNDGHFAYQQAPLDGHAFSLEPRATARLSGTLDSRIDLSDWPARALIVAFNHNAQRMATVSNLGDGNGRFEIAGLRPGAYDVSIQVQGHRGLIRRVELGDLGEDLGVLPLTPERADFTATVQDQNGAAIEGVVIRARQGEHTRDTAISDADGRFTLVLTPDPHTLELGREGFARLSNLSLQWGDDGFGVVDYPAPVRFVLRADELASVTGQVESELGALNDWSSRGFATLVSVAGDTRRVEPIADADLGRGQFQFTGLVPGRYTIGLSVRGHRPHRAEIDLPAGATPLGVIRLSPDAEAAHLRGRVTLAGRADHGGTLVRATVAGNLVATALTDPTGAFAFLASGDDHELTFAHEGFADGGASVTWDEADARFEPRGRDVAFDDAGATELVALADGAVTVCVVLSPDWVSDGDRGVFVRLLGPGAARTQAALAVRTPAACAGHPSKATFGGLPVGAYVVSVDRPGFGSASGQVTVSAQVLEPPEVVLAVGLERLADADLNMAAVGRLDRDDLLAAGDLDDAARLHNADLRGVDLTGADLSCLDFTGADLSSAVLDGADLTGAILAGADLTDASLVGARLHAHAMHVELQYADFAHPTAHALAGDGPSLVFNGGAGLDGRSLRVTDALASQASSVWLDARQPVGDGFETTFSFRITDQRDGVFGGDGFAFVVHADPGGTAALGAQGGDLGYAGITRAVVVELDTFGGDHVAIHASGVAPITAAERTVAQGGHRLATTGPGVDMDDGGFHDVRIRYTGGSLRVEIDGNLRLNTVVDLASYLGAGATAWVGFTGGTGGDYERHEIANWTWGGPVDACPGPRRETDLSGARFVDADLTGALLTDSPALRGAPCGGARPEVDVTGTSFRQADLSGANLSDLDLSGENFAGQTAVGAAWAGACLRDSNFSGANLAGASLDFADLTAASLANALLTTFDADGVSTPPSAREAALGQATLGGSTMEQIDLRGAALRGADLNGVNIVGARLDGIDATGASLLDALFGDVDVKPGAVPADCDLDGVVALPVGEWRFDGDVTDASGRGFDGTLQGNVSFVDGVMGQAAHFDGDGDYVEVHGVTGPLETDVPVTMTFWLRTSTPAYVNILGVHPANRNNVLGLGILGNGALRAFGPGQELDFHSGANDGEWHFVRFEFSGEEAMTTVLDGVPQTLSHPSPVAFSSATLFVIGREWDGAAAPDDFLGDIDELRVFLPCAAGDFAACSADELPRACRVTRTTMRGAVLDRANLSGARFGHVDLAGGSLRDAVLRSAQFDDSVLELVDFAGADLSGGAIVDSDLSGARFPGAALTSALLSRNLYRSGAGLTSFAAADLTHADLSGEDLRAVSFLGATMDHVILRAAELPSVNFSGVSMRGADLTSAYLSNVTAVDTDLAGAILTRAYVSGTLRGVSLARADLSSTTLDASFAPSDARAADFTDANLSDVFVNGWSDFRGARATGSRWIGADLNGAILTGAMLGRARFDGAWIRYASFTDADLDEARFNQALINGGDFRGAWLDDASFEGAQINRDQTWHVGGIDFTGAYVGHGFNENALDGATIENTDDIWCPDGRDSLSNSRCGYSSQPVLIEAGFVATVRNGALVAANPNWTFPGRTAGCDVGGAAGSRNFDAWVIRNRTDANVRLEVTPTPGVVGADPDTWLHLMDPRWDHSPVTGCISGEDDNGVGNAPLLRFQLNAGETRVVVLSQQDVEDIPYNLQVGIY